MIQGPRKRLWKARIAKTNVSPAEGHIVTYVEITDPPTESGRMVAITISPYLARRLAKQYGPWADKQLGPE